MTKLTVGKYKMKMANLGNECSVPPIFKTENVQQRRKSKVDEEDGLYVGYGFVNDVFPYRKQSLYTPEVHEEELPTVTLENQYLKAVFLPTLGARLWQLYDKKAGRDLILTSDEIAFGNLAVRDAWFCGGVEWNFGVIGHTPFTCAPIYTATLKTADGTPVIRFYEYERIRGCTYQVDCWLPEGSDRLFVGVRIVNPNEQVVPTYWWSNVALEENPRGRVIVPAVEAYTTKGSYVYKRKELQTAQQDITYPVQNAYAIDFFWKTKDAPNKFIAHLDETGYGLCQASSSMQQGRKLFVWGQSNGGNNWQKLLKTKSANGHYIEIQAGLGQTQYECVPMPPNTAWGWVESYGALQVDSDKVHGDYQTEQETVGSVVAGFDLESVWRNAQHMTQPAEEVIFEGSGWGALEVLFRQDKNIRPLSYNLKFSNMGKQQETWKKLLQEGTMGDHDPNEVPESWMNHEGFTQLLSQAACGKDSENWYTHLQLGVVLLANNQLVEAEVHLSKSVSLCPNAWAYYALACLFWKKGQPDRAVEEAKRSLAAKQDDVSLARAVIDVLAATGNQREVIRQVEQLPSNVREDVLLVLKLAVAYLSEGNIEKAEELTGNDARRFAPYVREGNLGVTAYWQELQRVKLAGQGKSTADIINQIPIEWDFRMFEPD